jgi:hypothetical protein
MPPPEDVDVGVDDAATLPEPEPHMPDMPEVSTVAEVVGIPDPVDIPDIAVGSNVVAAAGEAPPPSKVAVDPNISEADVPRVEHPAPLIVPVEAGTGLTPGDATSVAPSGMPVPPTAPAAMPSGEVAESEGVGVTAACAKAGLTSKGHTAVTIRKRFISVSMQQSSRRSHRSCDLRLRQDGLAGARVRIKRSLRCCCRPTGAVATIATSCKDSHMNGRPLGVHLILSTVADAVAYLGEPLTHQKRQPIRSGAGILNAASKL